MKVKLRYNIEEPFIEGLIRERGIENVEEFLKPSRKNLISPWQLDNVMEGIRMLNENLDKEILLVVDSDCDGYCSSAILYQYLMRVTDSSTAIDYFLHEKKEHGLQDVVNKKDLNDYNLVIIPDAGSNDDEYFKQYPYTKFLVLDHHLRTSTEPLPDNVVLINNQLSKEYSNKALSGAGVTWQFCRAFDEIYRFAEAQQLIDLASVAIIGDVMDITTPENSYIIHEGLDNIRNDFLKILVDNASFQLQGSKLSPIGIAFYVVPMINAMCRMGTLEEKERMFQALIEPHFQVECHKRGITKGTMVDVAIESARECTNAKARQKRLQDKMAQLCQKQIIENDLLSNKIITLVLDEDFDEFPSELNGLTATKIANDYGHPTIIGKVNEHGEYKGSIRGLSNVDMPPFKDFLMSSKDFEWIEGHQLAAGYAMQYNKLDSFNQWANQQLKDIDFNDKTWEVDFDKRADDKNLEHIIFDMDYLSQYWGQGFSEALISVKDIRVSRSDVQVLGKNADTVKVTHNGIAYMFFKRSEEEVKRLIKYPRMKLNIVGTANVNIYYNKTTPQIFIKDYELEDDSLGF